MEVLCYTQQRIFPKAGFCFALLQVCVGGSRGRQGKGSSILNTEEATVVTFPAVHQPGGGVQVFSRNPWGRSLPSASTQAHATVSFLRCLHTRHLQFLQSLAALTALLHSWISGPSSLPLALPRASLCTGKVPGCSCPASRPPPQTWPSCPWGWLGIEVL